MLQSAEQSLWAEGWSATFSLTALIFLPKNRTSDHQKNPNVSFVSKMSFVLTYFSKENIKSWKVNLKENCQPRAAATYLGKNPTPSANYPFPHPLPLRPLKAITLWCHLAYFLRKVWTLLPSMVLLVQVVLNKYKQGSNRKPPTKFHQ